MVGFSLRLVAVLWASLGLMRGSLAQLSDDDAIAAIPTCALPCMTSAISIGLCSPLNQTCLCTDEQFQETVTLCVTSSCTIPEALATRNATLTACGAEIRNRSDELRLLSHTMAAIAALCVITRFMWKILIAKVDIELDDWIILASIVIVIPNTVITARGTTANGLGKDVWTLTSEEITNFSFYFYLSACLYFLQVTIVKLSIIYFYIRIFPAKNIQRLLWGTFIFTSLWGFAFVMSTIFQCWPIQYRWVEWKQTEDGSCANVNAMSWANASINIALDLWMLGVPLWQIKHLQLHWKKKFSIAIMVCVGTFVTILSILRLQSLVLFASSVNTTWEFYDVTVWSTVEIGVGIMCACLPAIRMVLVRFFPVLGGSSVRSRGNMYYQHHNGAHQHKDGEHNSDKSQSGITGNNIRAGHDAVGVDTTEPANGDLEAGSRRVPLRTYELQSHDDNRTMSFEMDRLRDTRRSSG